MHFDPSTILVFITGILAGAVAALKIIAPRTKTKVDDKIEEYAEKGLDLISGVKLPS